MRTLAASLSFFLLSAFIASPPAWANDSGWIVEQTSQFGGMGRQLVTAKGSRYESLDGGYVAVTAAPSWKIFLFSDRKKLFFPCDARKEAKVMNGRKGILRMAVLGNLVESMWVPAYKTTFLGHPISVWKTVPKNKGKAKDKFRTIEFWAADDIPVAHEMAVYSATANGYPQNVDKLSIRCFALKSRGRKDMYMDSTSIKAASLSPTLFQVPPGYKKAASELEVVVNTDDLGSMVDTFTGKK